MLRRLLRRLIALFRAEPPLNRWFRAEPPLDPDTYVRAPIRRGPSGRTSSVALEEPPPAVRVRAFGRRAG
jgi:hypothetical protein